MASQMAMPREGHLEAVLHVFTFLRQNYSSRMVFDPTYPVVDMNDFKEWKWKDFNGDLNEAVPPKAPEERGKEFDLRRYFDSIHAGENKTRRSCPGIFIFFNTELVQWLSKKQATI